MIKLSASVSKKVPVPDVEFSSRSYSAGMEVEVSSGSGEEELKKELRALYGLLEEAIDEQIGKGDRAEAPSKGSPSPKVTESPKPPAAGRSRGNGRTATKAQLRAIGAIAKEGGYSEQDLQRMVSKTFGAEKPSARSIGEASRLIDTLKGNGKADPHED